MNPPHRQYEDQVCEDYREKHHRAKVSALFGALLGVWHWSVAPHELLYNAGYIHCYNEERLKRLGGPVPDRGFDGIAYDGEVYTGLQAKCWKESVSSERLGTFFEAIDVMRVKNAASRGHLYSTSYLTTATAESRMRTKKYDFTNMPYVPRPSVPPPSVRDETTCTLRPYQNEAVDALLHALWLVTLNVFSGGGKTLIAGNVLRRLQPRVVVVMAPLRMLVDQLHGRLKLFLPHHTHLVVDSDSGATTNPDRVREALAKVPVVIYTTYDSFRDVVTPLLPKDAYVVVDEAHNLTEEMLDDLETYTRGVLVSATLPDDIHERVECAYSYPLGRAIAEGYACDYQVFMPLMEGAAALDRTVTAWVKFLMTGMLERGSRRVIAYFASKNECAAFNKEWEKVAQEYHGVPAWTGTIVDSISAKTRKRILEAFEGDHAEGTLAVLSSVRILDEGIDVVRADGIFMSSVGSSDVRVAQRIQRSGRLDPKNPHKVNNVFIYATEEEITRTHVFETLKDQDPNFHKRVRALCADYDRLDRPDVRQRAHVQTAEWGRYVSMRCVSVLERMGQRVQSFVAWVEAHTRLPRQLTNPKTSEEQEEAKQAHFLITQLQAHKGNTGGRAHPEVIEVVRRLYPSKLETADEQRTKAIQTFVAWVEDHTRLPRYLTKPKTPEEEEEAKQAQFLNNQLSAHKGTNKGRVYPEVIEVVRRYDPSMLETADAQRTKAIQAFLAWVEAHTRLPSKLTNPKTPEEEEEAKQARFLKNQLQAHKGKGGRRAHPEVIEVVRRYDPSMLETADEQRTKTIQAFVAWVDAHTSLPRSITNPKTPEEKEEAKQGRFLDNQLRAHRGKKRRVYPEVIEVVRRYDPSRLDK